MYSNSWNRVRIDKIQEHLRIQYPNCYDLKTLWFSLFSTTFWVVSLMPAIFSHSTMVEGWLSPLNECVLDSRFPIGLAGRSRKLLRYWFAPIKWCLLAAFTTPCSYLKGLRHFSSFATIDFCFIEWDLNPR